MDLDDFKLINDRHGHAVGDRLLAAVAEAAGSALRSADIAARWGGEEFALVLATATSDGIEVVERLLRAVRELRIVTAEGYSFGCTASIGMALPTPDTERFEMLIERADRAMYRAKLAGKNRIARAEDADFAHAADLRPRAPVIAG